MSLRNEEEMKVLFIGDIVGNVGRQMIEDYLYRIRKISN